MIEEITIKFSPGTNIGAAITEAWECHAAKGCKGEVEEIMQEVIEEDAITFLDG
jgi:hypothetical protein